MLACPPLFLLQETEKVGTTGVALDARLERNSPRGHASPLMFHFSRLHSKINRNLLAFELRNTVRPFAMGSNGVRSLLSITARSGAANTSSPRLGLLTLPTRAERASSGSNRPSAAETLISQGLLRPCLFVPFLLLQGQENSLPKEGLGGKRSGNLILSQSALRSHPGTRKNSVAL